MITLGIIGVVAALTIPTLIANQRDKVTVTRLKKDFSILSQSVRLAIAENESTPDGWWSANADRDTMNREVQTKFVPYIKAFQNCGQKTGCFVDKSYKKLNGGYWHNLDKGTSTGSGSGTKLVLPDGAAINIDIRYPLCNHVVGTTIPLQEMCGYIHVDINGKNEPNTIGKDLFFFYLTKSGIIPAGTRDDTGEPFDASHCSKSGSGSGCTAWVIYNENLDYLKCNGLSWGGKTKCN